MLDQRLEILIRTLGIKKGEFAKKIHFSQAYISMLLAGNKTNPSDRFCEAIKSTFHVNPVWLREGKGDMFLTNDAHLSPMEKDMMKKYHSLSLTEKKMVEDVIEAFLFKRLYANKNGEP